MQPEGLSGGLHARGRKLVVIGGSSVHTPELLTALHDAGGLGLCEVCLVGRSAARVEEIGNRCLELSRRLQLNVKVTWETDLSVAARDATYVLNVLRVGGDAAEVRDRRDLAASGIVGHAASYPEAIRHLAPTLAAANVVQAVAPHAIFINFTNPVSILCEAVSRQTRLRCVGICHHAFSLSADFARLLRVDPERVRVGYRGLNHLGWVTDVLVDGTSRFNRLVDLLVARRVKVFDYQLVQYLDAIPIKHAGALYHRGDVLYVRQQGIRLSMEDALMRYAGGWRVANQLIGRTASATDASAWYGRCIVPFLATLAGAVSREHIVTWLHGGQVSDVPGCTSELTTLVHPDGLMAPLSLSGRLLPRIAQEWLREVRASEQLLIRATSERSPGLLFDALAVHPNVASVQHAREFVRRLTTGGLWND